MTAITSLLTAGAAYETVQPGVKNRLILLNFEEVASYTVSSGIVTAVTLDATKTGFAYEGYNNSVNAYSDIVKNEYGLYYKHSVKFRVFKRSDAIKQQIMKMAVTKIVALVENHDRNNDMTFELYGLDSGLVMQEGPMNMQDGGGVWDILLESDDTALEQLRPYTFYDTDYATTLAAAEALLT